MKIAVLVEDRILNLPNWVLEALNGNTINAIRLLKMEAGTVVHSDGTLENLRLVHAKRIVEMFTLVK